jgi:hypothetical protein
LLKGLIEQAGVRVGRKNVEGKGEAIGAFQMENSKG